MRLGRRSPQRRGKLAASVTRGRRPLLERMLVWGRLLAAFAVLLATPGAAQLLDEAVSIAIADDCCADPCDDEGEQSCPGTCGQCMCCAHPTALPAATPPQVAARVAVELVFRWPGERPDARGYREPPFRPPAA